MRSFVLLLALMGPAIADECSGCVSDSCLAYCEAQGGHPDYRPWVCQENSIFYSGPCMPNGDLWRPHDPRSPYYQGSRPPRGRY